MPASSSQSGALRHRVLRAGGWNIAGYGLGQAIRLGSNLIMTRLLAPEMFGIMAIASIVTMVLFLLSDLGLRQNIVQSRRGDDPAFLDTAWVVQIVRGFALWLIALAVSAGLYIADAGWFDARSVYASPELPAVIAVSALSAVILGFQSTRVATAHRALDQKRLMQLDLMSQLAGLGVMIPIGVATHSIWALVAGGLTTSLVATLLSFTWMEGRPNRLRCEPAALRELIAFGKWIFASSAIFVFVMFGDRLLLSAMVDVHVLGIYAIAALIVGTIDGGVSKFFMSVSLPALSEVARNNPQRLREAYYRLRLPVDVFLLFLAGVLFNAGQRVIDLLYDARYSGAGSILQVLSLSLFAGRYIVSQQAYVAVGIPRYQTTINIVRFLSLYSLVPLLYCVAGVWGAIWAVALHALAVVPLVYYFNAKLGLLDARRELAVLLALPAGYLCGMPFA
jgi:O-antigen/teichoic acid export membrane protein